MLAKGEARACRLMPLVDSCPGSEVAAMISPPGHMQKVVTLSAPRAVGGRETRLYSAAPSSGRGGTQPYLAGDPCRASADASDARQPSWKPLGRWATWRPTRVWMRPRALWPGAIRVSGALMRSPVASTTPPQRGRPAPSGSTMRSATCARQRKAPPQASMWARRRLHMCGRRSEPMCGWWRHRIARCARRRRPRAGSACASPSRACRACRRSRCRRRPRRRGSCSPDQSTRVEEAPSSEVVAAAIGVVPAIDDQRLAAMQGEQVRRHLACRPRAHDQRVHRQRPLEREVGEALVVRGRGEQVSSTWSPSATGGVLAHARDQVVDEAQVGLAARVQAAALDLIAEHVVLVDA